MLINLNLASFVHKRHFCPTFFETRRGNRFATPLFIVRDRSFKYFPPRFVHAMVSERNVFLPKHLSVEPLKSILMKYLAFTSCIIYYEIFKFIHENISRRVSSILQMISKKEIHVGITFVILWLHNKNNYQIVNWYRFFLVVENILIAMIC